jgi:hypothetical protein
VSELKVELQDYFLEHSGLDFEKCFENEEWLEKLAYLADILLTHEPAEQVSARSRRKCFDFK